MIGKNPSPVIGNLITGKLGSGDKFAGAGPTSPTSPLEFKIHSPRGLRTYDVGTGVGLGILAALEKSVPEIPTKNSFCCRNFNRSDPIPISAASSNYNRGGILEDVGNEEEFTYVTRRNQNKWSTRVYRDGYEYSGKESRVSRKNKGGGGGGGCIFDITPARFCDSSTPYHGTDFLSSCNLCKKKLHGKDIYMYRGEKAFCSKECRYRQIMKDEEQHKEKCSSEASSRSSSSSSSNVDVSISISPCKNGNMFSTGIFAI